MNSEPRFITAAEMYRASRPLEAAALETAVELADVPIGPVNEDVELSGLPPTQPEPWSQEAQSISPLHLSSDEEVVSFAEAREDAARRRAGAKILASIAVQRGPSGSVRTSAPAPEPETPDEEPKKTFRLQGRRFMFTYATHLGKEEYINWFQQLTHRIPVFIRLAHETGDESVPYNHTHVVIDMGSVYNKRDATTFFDFPAPPEYVDRNGVPRDTIHPNIKTLPSARAFDDAKGYLSKQDPDNEDLASFVRRERRNQGSDRDRNTGSLVEQIWEATTIQDALRLNVAELRDATGVLQIYQHRPETGEVDPHLTREELWPWQAQLVNEVGPRAIPHHGKVIWYFDPDGQHGKGRVQEYLEDAVLDSDGARKWLCIAGSCSSRHVMLHAHNERRAGWTGHGVCIDVTRTRSHNDELYTIIELFLNARWTVSMYNTGRGRIPSPWVIVFANFWPRIDALSTSRWVLRELSGPQGENPEVIDRDIDYRPVESGRVNVNQRFNQ